MWREFSHPWRLACRALGVHMKKWLTNIIVSDDREGIKVASQITSIIAAIWVVLAMNGLLIFALIHVSTGNMRLGLGWHQTHGCILCVPAKIHQSAAPLVLIVLGTQIREVSAAWPEPACNRSRQATSLTPRDRSKSPREHGAIQLSGAGGAYSALENVKLKVVL